MNFPFYIFLKENLENPYLSTAEFEHIITYFSTDVFIENVENKTDIIDGVKYWLKFYDDIKNSTTNANVLDAIKKYLLQPTNKFTASKYNMVIFVQKAATHQMWRKLYNINTGLNQEYDFRDGISIHNQLVSDYMITQGYTSIDDMINKLDNK